MAKSRKVILFLVEGISDEESLSVVLSDIIRDDNVSFQITNGDLTSQKGINQQNIIQTINKKVTEYISKSKVERSDILQIIHLIDIDGAYINDKIYFQEDPSIEKGFVYMENKICASNTEKIIKRNEQKSLVMNKLISLSEIGGTKYKAYYFCCNLDHVFHNERNLDATLKFKYAEKFQDDFYEKEKEFLTYISESDFVVPGSHLETWNFLKEGLNSLGRYTNFNLFFEEFREFIKEEFLE